MAYKYTARELRAWHRGHQARTLGKPYRCNSKDENYIAAWRAGWFAAEREAAQQVVASRPFSTGQQAVVTDPPSAKEQTAVSDPPSTGADETSEEAAQS